MTNFGYRINLLSMMSTMFLECCVNVSYSRSQKWLSHMILNNKMPEKNAMVNSNFNEIYK